MTTNTEKGTKSKLSVYDIITEHIVQRLENGVIPWKIPWDPNVGMPKNIRGNAYRGINAVLLNMVAWENGYADNTWLTFTQVANLKGAIIKGSVSTPVVFWKVIDKKDRDPFALDSDKIFLLRYYRVFNIAQTEGIKTEDIPKKIITELSTGEDIVNNYPNPPSITQGGNMACYVPSKDLVQVPLPDMFDSTEEYYSTLFHELVHSTSHESRLARKYAMSGVSAGELYSKEELVAEFGSSFLCGKCGILPAVIDNQAAYIKSWLTALKDDSKMVVQASAAAQKAVDHILAREVPK